MNKNKRIGILVLLLLIVILVAGVFVIDKMYLYSIADISEEMSINIALGFIIISIIALILLSILVLIAVINRVLCKKKIFSIQSYDMDMKHGKVFACNGAITFVGKEYLININSSLLKTVKIKIINYSRVSSLQVSDDKRNTVSKWHYVRFINQENVGLGKIQLKKSEVANEIINELKKNIEWNIAGIDLTNNNKIASQISTYKKTLKKIRRSDIVVGIILISFGICICISVLGYWIHMQGDVPTDLENIGSTYAYAYKGEVEGGRYYIHYKLDEDAIIFREEVINKESYQNTLEYGGTLSVVVYYSVQKNQYVYESKKGLTTQEVTNQLRFEKSGPLTLIMCVGIFFIGIGIKQMKVKPKKKHPDFRYRI